MKNFGVGLLAMLAIVAPSLAVGMAGIGFGAWDGNPRHPLAWATVSGGAVFWGSAIAAGLLHTIGATIRELIEIDREPEHERSREHADTLRH